MMRKLVLWWVFFQYLEKVKINPKFNFSSQNLRLRCIFFQMRWKNNQDMTPTFSYIYKWEKINYSVIYKQPSLCST